MTGDETCGFGGLQARLGITRARLIALMREGLPWSGKPAKKRFFIRVVDEWLLAHGYAVVAGAGADVAPAADGGCGPVSEPGPATPDAIARTYAELARALGMQAKNAERILQRFAVTPGFPGKPGTPGKRDGWFPVEEIRAWIAARPGGGASAAAIDEELQAIRKRIAKLALERDEQELLTRLGRLADVDEVVRFNRQCVANAKAVLEPLPDEMLDLLPRSIGGDVRTRIHRRAQKLVDDAWENLARLVAGDDERDYDGEN